MTQAKRDNQHKILRFLYMNRGETKSTSEVAHGTDLSKGQVFYALDDWLRKFLKIESGDTSGDIEDANEYIINKRGRRYVREEIDEVSQDLQNAEKLDKHDKEIMRLRAGLNDVQDDLEDWSKYSTEWNETAEERFRSIETRLKYLEDVLSDHFSED
ncbi:hypothetical protein BDK61_2875 [Haloarcula quadrata]|uniref:Uncharacterized protein n=1 Tax=Haloarcula quadrata TaxID=182779 RepID=A0A495R8F7_9EURY|nr:hypothetical protein [Haloarcula quadrata]RKS83490.1 hypothetical protein BDK61_2875 [Haloarcula quadrata]